MSEERWRAEWEAALDSLELDVAQAEQMLVEFQRGRDLPLADPWTPPTGLGPLPLGLKARADQVLERQTQAALGIARALATTKRQAAVADRIDTGRDSARPVYLDCAL